MTTGSAPARTPSASATTTPSLTVAKIMTAKVHSILPEMTVRDAINLVLKNKIGGAPVVDSAKKVMSVITEGDLLKLAASVGMEKTIFQCMIKLTKTDKLITIKKTDTFADIYKKLLSLRVHRLIVVDDMGRLEGIVSRSNVLRVLADPDSEEAGGTKPAKPNDLEKTKPKTSKAK